jgi:membrane associated rhomboid family serine protease
MSRLNRYLTRMALFLAVVGAVAALTFPVWWPAFMANPALNGVIVGVLAFGCLYVIRQATRLKTEIDWVRAVQKDRRAAIELDEPPLIGALARMMADRSGQPLHLSPIAMRSVLDGIATRLDETREISRYFVGLLIFLGLLGTFWGLLKTVGSVGAVVGTLTLGGDTQAMFQTLKDGLTAPLAGMGTAFSASLFGLAGSLILGFLDLQSGQAQNRFFIDLEDWLSSSARVGARAGGGDGEAAAGAGTYLQALLEQTADHGPAMLATLDRIHAELVQNRAELQRLTRTIAQLAEQERKD